MKMRRWRISIAGMMILVLFIGIPLGWKARRASLQRRAVARINALQGTVVYDWQRAKPGQTEPPGPAWLKQWLGWEYFQEIEEVFLPKLSVNRFNFPLARQTEENSLEHDLSSGNSYDKTVIEPLTEDQLACLESCDQLRRLTIHEDFPLQQSAWDRLAQLSKLERLWYLAPLKPSMDANLGRLTSLESLTLMVEHNRVDKTNSQNLDFLARLPHLKTLVISGSGFTQQNLTVIGQLQNLEDLIISDMYTSLGKESSYDPDFFAPLGQLPRLTSLELHSRRNSANLTKYLARIRSLEAVSLTDIPLDDESLSRLKTLPRLRILRADVTRVDPRVLEEFNRDRPTVSITPPRL